MPPGKVLFAVLAVTGLVFALALGLGQRARTKEAERRAKLSEQETRLAHASRVNAMDEMASGKTGRGKTFGNRVGRHRFSGTKSR